MKILTTDKPNKRNLMRVAGIFSRIMYRRLRKISHTTKVMTLSLVVVMATLYQFRDYFTDTGINMNFFSDKPSGRDLSQIKKSGKLKVLVVHSSTGYFVFKGETMGYDYEMIKLFAKHLGVKPEFVIAKDLNLIYENLAKGEYDLVTSSSAIIEEKSLKIVQSEPLYLTQQVLVQKKPAGWQHMATTSIDSLLIRNKKQLTDRKIALRKNTVFYAGIGEVSKSVKVEELPGNMRSEDIIKKVACGEAEYTMAFKEVAFVNSLYFPDLDVMTVIKEDQPVTWVTNSGSPQLLNELNAWIKSNRNKSKFNYLYKKYYSDLTGALARYYSENHSSCDTRISPYDDLIKPYSKMMQWDWRLFASMICQESRFNPNARSHMGANGLMQLMPSTAYRFGLDSIRSSPLENIKAGTKFLLTLDEYWQQTIDDNEERQKFVMASYNAGLGHVIDAKRLAEKHGCDPKLWEDVSCYLLKLAKPEYYNDEVVKHGYCNGEEPYYYVQRILERYNHYRNLYQPGYRGEMQAGKIDDQSLKGLIASYKKKVKEAGN